MHENLANANFSFPHMGDYHVIFRELLGIFTDRIFAPPPITRRTLELGTQYSPDSACVPFKYNLGNYIEAIELGADTFFTIAGGCRFEYYFEVHRRILKDLGHSVRFIRISEDKIFRVLREINPRLSRLTFINGFWLLKKKLHLLDELDDIKRKRIGFQTVKGSFEGFWSRFLERLPEVKSHRELKRFTRDSREEILSLPIDKPKHPLRVGIIGELYVVMEPFSNQRIEEKLAGMGVEIHRWITVSSILHHGVNGAKAASQFLKWAKPYASYHLGAHGTESVGRLHKMIREGFDGAIHLKPFGCMPEINALPAIHKMARDYQFPLVSFSLDSHTAETGVITRLEAFRDMISYKRLGGLPCLNAT